MYIGIEKCLCSMSVVLHVYQHLCLLVSNCTCAHNLCVHRLATGGDLCGDGDPTGASPVVVQTPNQMSRPQQEEDEITEAMRNVSV